MAELRKRDLAAAPSLMPLEPLTFRLFPRPSLPCSLDRPTQEAGERDDESEPAVFDTLGLDRALREEPHRHTPEAACNHRRHHNVSLHHDRRKSLYRDIDTATHTLLSMPSLPRPGCNTLGAGLRLATCCFRRDGARSGGPPNTPRPVGGEFGFNLPQPPSRLRLRSGLHRG